jgi:hypothetical protein
MHAVVLIPVTPSAPWIGRDPESQRVVSGSGVNFLAVANGIPLPTYQWQRSIDGGTTWTAVIDGGSFTGSGTRLLTVTNTSALQDGERYRAVASNAAGTITSAAAQLNVSASAVAPTIVTPPSGAVATKNGDLTLTVLAAGTVPLSYQWYRDGVAIPAGTNARLSINTVQAAHAGHYSVTISNSAGSVTSAAVSVGVMSVTPETLQFGAERAGANGPVTVVSPAQTVTLTFNTAAPPWTATADQPWVLIAPAAGAGSGQLTVGLDSMKLPAGATSASATVTLAGASTSLGATIPVSVSIQATASTSAPFGAFDMPIAGANVSGSFAVTGWALDDIGVQRVELWRDLVSGETTAPYAGPGPGTGKVFIANALFVPNSRPDVEAAYPAYPLASRAGWGYLLLTYGLWGQGNGTYTLYAFAYDQDGHVTTLGTKAIVVDNAHAVKPFGAIDTPTYGGTILGSIWNYGWALTPGPSCAVAGGTVQVSIDSGPLQPVVYGDSRPDIAASFPSFTDGAGGGGHYYLDSTVLANGLHQIGWLVSDNCGRQDGIGSRFFTVANAGADAIVGASRQAAPPRVIGLGERLPRTAIASAESVRPAESRVSVRQLGGEWETVTPGDHGTHVVEVAPSGRIELRLPTSRSSYAGRMFVSEGPRDLPLGSSLDARAGIFYWQPAPGFLGAYELEFLAADHAPLSVRVVVGPPIRVVIDTPAWGETTAQPVCVAGWALDLASASGSGIDTIHIWGYPLNGAAPIFLGVADVGDARADVARVYGPQFEGAAFGLSAADLEAGTYDIVVYPHRARTNTFDGAQVVRVVVK